MELNAEKLKQSEQYLAAYAELIGDKRTAATLRGVIEGIIAGESLRAAVIARFSP